MEYTHMPDVPVLLYERPTLISFSKEYLSALGATPEEAAIVADGMVTAAARWHPGKGQGIEKLFRLTEQCHIGGVQPGAPFEVVRQTPALALVDGHKGFGYVVGSRAGDLAVEKARVVGTGTVIVRHSNHFGQAGYHAERITKAGMIGLVMTNAKAEMAPWGGTTPVLGTNPWAVGIPRADAPPILLDMALTSSGRGMIAWAFREGESIPDDWALTVDGRRSSDPADYMSADGAEFRGTQFPIGGFKGYGLSLFTDVLAGVMSGALFGLSVFTDEANHDVGHVFLAIDPTAVMDRAEFEQRLEQLVSEVKSADRIDPAREILLPGELEFARERERAEEGIPVDVETVKRLRELASEIGVPCPL